MAVAWGLVVDISSGVLLVALGAFVLSIRPRTAPNVALAAYVLALGTSFALLNVGIALAPRGPGAVVSALVVASAVLLLPAIAALAVLAARFPSRAPRIGLAAAVAATAVFLVVLASAFPNRATVIDAVRRAAGVPDAFAAVSLFAGDMRALWRGAVGAALVLFAHRYATATDARARTQIALLSAGLATFFAASAAAFVYRPGIPAWAVALGWVVILSVPAAWLVSAARSQDPRRGRDVAVFFLACSLVAMVATLGFGAAAVDASGLFGAMRTLGVLVLAYAILKGQLLDVDLKIKWTIRRGTLAAIFLAVFFVVAQVGQNLSQGMGVVLGGVATGLLLFAIAPLQRVAERMAEAAVPGVGDRVVTAHPDEDLYREALRLALQGGAATKEAERTLGRLADRLRIPAGRAVELRHEAEADAEAQRGGPASAAGGA